jgi:hypothetical protein
MRDVLLDNNSVREKAREEAEALAVGFLRFDENGISFDGKFLDKVMLIGKLVAFVKGSL